MTSAVSEFSEFIARFDNDQAVVRSKSFLKVANLTCFYLAPLGQIPWSLFNFGKRVVHWWKPDMFFEQRGSRRITSESLPHFAFGLDTAGNDQLQKNFQAIFNHLKQHPRNNITIHYVPSQYDPLKIDCGACDEHGQIFLNASLANLTEDAAVWLLEHEMSHYVNKDRWKDVLYSVCSAAVSLSLMRYFNRPFLAFYLSQVVFWKGLTLLKQSYERRADLDGIKMTGSNQGAKSFFIQMMVAQSLAFLRAFSKYIEIYNKLPPAERVMVLQHIAQNHPVNFDPVHPSPRERLQMAENSLV